MNYQQHRSNIQQGDVVAFQFAPWSIFSQVISIWTRSKFSHVGIVMKVHGRLAVIEALEGVGVRIHPLSRLIKTRKIHWFQVTDDNIDRDEITRSALTRWGCKYASPWQFIRSFSLVTSWLCDRLGVDRDTNPNRFFCSEYVMHCLHQAGYQGDSPAHANTTPDDITRLPCLQHQGLLE